MKISRERRIDRAQMKTLFAVPFFAPGLSKLPVIFDEGIETACTDGKVIRISPVFMDKLTDPQVPTLLCHEVLHPLMGHLWRMPEGGDPDVWNQAADHEINLMLKEWSKKVMEEDKVADPFPFPEGNYCCDPRFTGMNVEKIYYILLKEKQAGKAQKPSAKFGEFTNSPGGNGSGQESKGQGKDGAAAGQGQTAKQLENDWTATMLQSARIAAGQGTLPGNIERMVTDIVEPKIDWTEILRSLLREQCADDWDWLHPAMEYEGSGFILPSLRSEKMGPVIFATDTSGSIDAGLLAKFRAEKQNCLDDMRPSKLVDIYCDARIQKIAEFTVGDTIDGHAPGGGGTSFVPVFDHINTLQEKPKCIVYLTDLMGDFPPDDGGVPTIWVTWTKGGTAPFGEVVYADI